MANDSDLLENLRAGGVIFDGGMGSMLIAKGLKTGLPPEEWNLSRPADVREVHESYLRAGAIVVGTNTFGATTSRMKSFGLGDQLDNINVTAVRLAREASDGVGKDGERRSFVALSVGPTGKMFPPVGNATEEEIKAEFDAQIKTVADLPELILVETMFDLREGLLALESAKALTSVPVAVTLTFNKNPRGFFTIMGDECGASIKRLGEAGADVVGANCTIASGEMVELARILRESTSLPVLCQPNAGSPTVKRGMPVYEQTPEDFAQDAVKIFEAGINAVGGCCGTTPDFIRAVSSRL